MAKITNDNSRSDDIYEKALLGKNIPILPLDNKWYRLMVGLEKTKEMSAWEEEIKELLKKQGRLNTDIKKYKKLKAKLMDDIVGLMDDADGVSKQEECRKQIEDCNLKIDEYQEEVLTLPDMINELNYNLMLATMEQCYEIIQDNTESIDEISQWITNIRIELKKNLVRKQDKELKNQEIYNYMHDIFGPDVIDIFDMKYDPGEKQLKKSSD